MSLRKFIYIKYQAILALLVILGIITLLSLIFFKKSTFSLWSIFKIGPVCKKCNVILVSLDDVGSSHLPCYGYERNTAPNLCSFAKKNIYFANSFSNASFTLPSHFSIFTGLYPSHHGMLVPFKDILSPQIITLPQVLQSNGYETIYVGPTNDVHLPIDKGFGKGFNYFYDNSLLKSIKNWSEGCKRLLANAGQNRPTFLFLHNFYVNHPFLFLDKRIRQFTTDYYPNIPITYEEYFRFSDRLFLYILDTLSERIKTGGPLESINRDKEMYQLLKNAPNLIEAEKIFWGFSRYEVGSFFIHYYLDKLIDKNDPKQVEYIKALYDELLFDLDHNLLLLFDLINNPKLKNNTIIIFFGDHGEEFMEHGNLSHGINLYNTVTSVPLIMYIPNVKSRRIDDLVQEIDIFPTILNLVGLKTPSGLDGIDLSGLVIGKPNASRNQYLISQLLYKDAIRDQRRKLYIDYQTNTVELYNLETDSLEQKNIASQSVQIVKHLSNTLKTILDKNPISLVPTMPFPSWIDEAKRKKLIKDGYF